MLVVMQKKNNMKKTREEKKRKQNKIMIMMTTTMTMMKMMLMIMTCLRAVNAALVFQTSSVCLYCVPDLHVSCLIQPAVRPAWHHR